MIAAIAVSIPDVATVNMLFEDAYQADEPKRDDEAAVTLEAEAEPEEMKFLELYYQRQ